MENPKCNESEPKSISLPDVGTFDLLHTDPLYLALDKPAGFVGRTPPAPFGADFSLHAVALEAALAKGIAADAVWSKELKVRLLEPIHSLDADATGILLLAKSAQSARALVRLSGERKLRVDHLAVVGGKPKHRRWMCCLKIRPDPAHPGRVLTDATTGQFAETEFEVLGHGDGMALILASTITDRPHQIRAHLAVAGLPVVGDTLYGFGRDLPRRGRQERMVERTAPRRQAGGKESGRIADRRVPLALRAIRLGFPQPETGEPVEITAPFDQFLSQFGFDAELGNSETEE